MRWLVFLCTLLCISVFQSTVIQYIIIGSAMPDLYFSVVVFYSFIADMKRSTFINWITGLSKDLFSVGDLGINSVFFVAIGLLIWSVKGVLFRGHVITQVLVAFVFSIMYNTLYVAYIIVSFHSLYFLTAAWNILICSLYTATIVPVLFWIFSRFQSTLSFSPLGDK
ncbi:MAG: rod shape-determining protein MreD [Candidatus Loosdrechtia sp.]|uniref:rod shape-determining protein MreD n=1 Tax=Candidatus Loosdrechtia sp. TaxID=3101272 RepID=UPI003A6CD188|nr:MAG: rod shape-determining protein MreD [Candidatus Jettenia sp. AMX2]